MSWGIRETGQQITSWMQRRMDAIITQANRITTTSNEYDNPGSNHATTSDHVTQPPGNQHTLDCKAAFEIAEEINPTYEQISD